MWVSEWQLWFAWRPVRTLDGEWCWLRRVMRRQRLTPMDGDMETVYRRRSREIAREFKRSIPRYKVSADGNFLSQTCGDGGPTMMWKRGPDNVWRRLDPS